MSKSLGSLTLDLIAKTGNFTGPLDQAARKAKRSGKDIADAADGANQSWAKLAPVIKGALAGISIGAIATSFIGNTKRMEQEQAQLAAVLKSTGHAAGFTRDELNGMADVMEGATTFSAGEINQAQTNLLAFSGVVGDQFKRAMQSVIDMSARTGMAVTASAETIGRALDIPTAGLGALSKQGFRFTDDQKALVKQLEETGRVAEAQGIILDALEESYAGAAGAARDTFGGALTALANTIDGRLTGGEGTLVLAKDAVNALNDTLSSPAGAKGIQLLTVATGGLALVIGGRLVGSVVASGTAFTAAQIQAARYQMTLASMAGVSNTAAVGIGVLTAASRAATAGMALLGGPVGAVVVAGAALAYYSTRASDAEKESAELDRRINELGTSFEGLSKKGAEAAIVNYQNKVKLLKEESIEAGKETLKWHRYLADAPDGAWAAQYRDNITLARDAQEILSSKILDTEQKITQLKAIANGDPLGGLSSSAAAASSTFEKMNQQIQEQILQLNNRTGAALLAARAEAGYVKDLQDGELELLLVGERQLDALKDKIAAQNKAASAAESSAKSQRSAAASAAKKAAEAAKAIQDSVTALELQASQFYMNADAVKLYELKVKGATDAQLKLAEASLATIEVLEAQKKINEDASGIIESLRTQEEAVQASYNKRKEIILASTELTEAEKTEAMLRLQKERDQDLLDAGDDYWAKYLSAAEKALLNFDALAESTISNFSSRFGSAFEAMIFDAQTLEDAMFNLAEGMVRSVVNAIGQMIAQWVAYQAVQLLVGKTTQASGVAAISANAAAASLMSGLNAFSSTAAIPIVGPDLAPAAMGAAISITAPLASAVSLAAGAGLAGMAHDGIDSIPEDGTWLLQKGERVTTAGTSDKLDRTLEQIRQGQQAGGGNMQFALTIYADGKEQGAAPPELAGMVNSIKSIVNEQIMTAMRPGGPLNRR